MPSAALGSRTRACGFWSTDHSARKPAMLAGVKKAPRAFRSAASRRWSGAAASEVANLASLALPYRQRHLRVDPIPVLADGQPDDFGHRNPVLERSLPQPLVEFLGEAHGEPPLRHLRSVHRHRRK